MSHNEAYQNGVQVLPGDHAVGALIDRLADVLLIPADRHLGCCKHLLGGLSDLWTNAITYNASTDNINRLTTVSTSEAQNTLKHAIGYLGTVLR